MRHITDNERRARLAVRHAIAPGHRVADPEAATRAMTVLHATEPPTVFLSFAARVDGVKVADLDRALYEERTLVKQLAMRRTLFVFPGDLLPAAWGGPGARVAGQEHRKIAKDVVGAGLTADGDAWLAEARTRLLDALVEPDGLPVKDIRVAVPMLGGTVAVSPGTKWGGEVPLAPRVLAWLGAEGVIVRGRNAGHWRLSRPAWTSMSAWLGGSSPRLREAEAYAALVGRWLRSFGPGTEADLVWWLGATKTAVRRALADVGAVPVSLDGGLAGWVLPDDEAEADPVEPWAALLPVLDPTTMGWRDGSSTSTPATRRTSSTATATAAPPRGGTDGSWGAGSRTTPGPCASSRVSTSPPPPRPRWRWRPRGSPRGWAACGSAASTARARWPPPACREVAAPSGGPSPAGPLAGGSLAAPRQLAGTSGTGEFEG